MSDVITRKDVDELRKSLMELISVVNGLAQKISGTMREISTNRQQRWDDVLG